MGDVPLCKGFFPEGIGLVPGKSEQWKPMRFDPGVFLPEKITNLPKGIPVVSVVFQSIKLMWANPVSYAEFVGTHFP